MPPIISTEPSTTVWVALTAGNDETAKLDIARGFVIGAVNGMAMVSACRLVVFDGRLEPRAQHQRRSAA